MKRVLSLALALCLVVGMFTVGASAKYSEDPNHFTADDAGNQNTAGIDASTVVGDEIAKKEVTVNIKTTLPGSTTNVYAVSYSVTDRTFTYNMGGAKIWNPEELKYETAGGAGTWSNDTQEITVTNYSDLPVKVEASVDQTGMAEEGVVTVTAEKKTDGGREIELASAYNSSTPSLSAATSGIFEVKVSGTPTYEYTTATKLATITLTLTKGA